MFYCFFFQAEDGIRDHCVTGVQTCALPIAFAADLAAGPRVVRVVSHERGHVECRGEASLAVLQQVEEALVGVGRGAEPGEHPHGPDLAAVHRLVGAAGEGEVAGLAQIARGIGSGAVARVIEHLVPRDDGAREAGTRGLAAHRSTSRTRSWAPW